MYFDAKDVAQISLKLMFMVMETVAPILSKRPVGTKQTN